MLICMLLLYRTMNNIDNIFISLVCDNAFRIIVKFFLTVADMLFDVLHEFRIKFQFFPNHFIAFKQLDRVPAQIITIYFIFDTFFDMSERMLHTSAINMRDIAMGMMLCKIDCFLCSILAALSF